MTEAEILAALAANDQRAIRPILTFLACQADGDYIAALAAEQAGLRAQLEALRNAAAN